MRDDVRRVEPLGRTLRAATGAVCACALCASSACVSPLPGVARVGNPALETIKPGYEGNCYGYGRFCGKHVSAGSETLGRFVRWKLAERSGDGAADERFEMSASKADRRAYLSEPSLTWLGHGSVLLRLGGRTIVVDPLLSSPRFFHGERSSEAPLRAADIEVDYLLVSHGHRDHLDQRTVRELGGASIRAYVPLKMGHLLERWNARITVQEAGWYQRFDTDSPVAVYLLPAHHWHRRSLFDTNRILWGSYLIEYDGLTVYLAGDSGYSGHFKAIGELFEDIDYAVLPIGSYAPEELVGASHMTPEEAVWAFDDLGAGTLVPIHYGTYRLSPEPWSEPLRRLDRQIEDGRIAEEAVDVVGIGETIRLDPGRDVPGRGRRADDVDSSRSSTSPP